MTTARDRAPIGIGVVCCVTGLVGLAAVLVGGLVAASAGSTLPQTMLVVGGGILLAGLLSFPASYGLWSLERWGWLLIAGLWALLVLFGGVGLVLGEVSLVLALVAGLGVLGYLFVERDLYLGEASPGERAEPAVDGPDSQPRAGDDGRPVDSQPRAGGDGRPVDSQPRAGDDGRPVDSQPRADDGPAEPERRVGNDSDARPQPGQPTDERRRGGRDSGGPTGPGTADAPTAAESPDGESPTCPGCGNDVGTDWQYCQNCGEDLSGA